MAPVLEHPVELHTEQLASLRSDVDSHEDRIRAMETMLAVHDHQFKSLFQAVGEIKQMVSGAVGDIRDMREKPAKRWDDLIGYIIAALAAGVVGWFLRG